MIFRKLLALLPVLAAIIACLVSFAAESLMPFLVLALLPPLVFLVGRCDVLAVLTLASYASALTLPQFPSQLALFHVLACMLALTATLMGVVKGQERPLNRVHGYVFGFLIVLLVTASFRGFGLKVIGGDMWGGTPYVYLVVASVFYLQTWNLRLSTRQWTLALWGLCGLSLIPTMAVILGRYMPVDTLAGFIQMDANGSSQAMWQMVGNAMEMNRLDVANVSSAYMFLLALIAYRAGFWRRVLAGGILMVALVLTGVSGHRVSMVYGIGLIVAFSMLDTDVSLRRRLINPYSVMIWGLLVGLVVMAHHLPLEYQRALSWLPFAKVEQVASSDAEATWLWRLDVWAAALKEVPGYLILGKGFAYSFREVAGFVVWSMNDINYVLTSRSYHNGLLAILIDLGLPGLICCLGFVWVTLRLQWRNLGRDWNSLVLRHYHRVFLASFIAQVIVFVLMSGGPTTFVTLFVWLCIMEGVVRTDEARFASLPDVPGAAGGYKAAVLQ